MNETHPALRWSKIVHSDGTWSVRAHVGEGGECVARQYGFSPESNGDLICAAPDLQAACEAQERAWAALGDPDIDRGSCLELCDVAKDLTSRALARSKGESFTASPSRKVTERVFEVTFRDYELVSLRVSSIKAASYDDATEFARSVLERFGLNVNALVASTGIDYEAEGRRAFEEGQA